MPGTGINPGNENMILGKILNTNIKKGEQFKRKFLKIMWYCWMYC